MNQTEQKMDRVLQVLRTLRLNPAEYERTIGDAIADALVAAMIDFEREFDLGPRMRIDFRAMLEVGIEIKKGKPNSTAVIQQIERYCASPKISSLIIVVERSLFNRLNESNGKPISYIALNKQWGIAL